MGDGMIGFGAQSSVDQTLREQLDDMSKALRLETERRQALELELCRRDEALHLAERQKDEFLSVLAHELRNPLTPILTATEMIRHANREDRGVERFRCVIERQAQTLARMIDELLDVSRITRGSITLQKKKVELGALVRSAIEATKPLMNAARHELVVTLPSHSIYVLGDPTRLEQVMSHVLRNAAKYTTPRGKIGVSLEAISGSAKIVVSDNGVGIAPDLLPRVFDLFVHGEEAVDRAQRGLGVGLTLVQRLVAMHGGEVTAISEGVGRGSEFVLRFPLAKDDEIHHGSGKTNGRSCAHRGARRALVVEDNIDAADMLADLLAAWGYEVRAARSGEVGVTLAGEFSPHIVLLDIGLPGMDGFEVARRLRMTNHKEPLLIAVTGYGQDSDRRRAHEVGIDHHLVKPLEPQRLRELLTTLEARLETNAP